MDYTFAICQVAHLDADGDGGGETLLINLADKENKIDSLGDHIVVRIVTVDHGVPAVARRDVQPRFLAGIP